MYEIGYTQGVFDLFHVGHENLLRRAKELCRRLVVGVNSDRLVYEYKHIRPSDNENKRLAVIKELPYIDECLIVDTLDKLEIYRIKRFDVVFIGDDWKGNQRWIDTEIQLKRFSVPVLYLPHTPNISSTLLRNINYDEK